MGCGCHGPPGLRSTRACALKAFHVVLQFVKFPLMAEVNPHSHGQRESFFCLCFRTKFALAATELGRLHRDEKLVHLVTCGGQKQLASAS